MRATFNDLIKRVNTSQKMLDTDQAGILKLRREQTVNRIIKNKTMGQQAESQMRGRQAEQYYNGQWRWSAFTNGRKPTGKETAR